MVNRNVFYAIILAVMLLTQACATGNKLNYVQAYYDNSLMESEIAWVYIGNIYDEDGKGTVLGDIQVLFEEPTINLSSANLNCEMFAFQAGEHKFQVRYYYQDVMYSTSSTQWRDFTKIFEGGKCYEIYAQKSKQKGGFLGTSNTYYQFKFREANCYMNTWRYKTVDLYRLGGYKANPTIDLLKSYDINDDMFAPYQKANRNNVLITTLPFEFIRKLYSELE